MFILDMFTELYIWVGRKSRENEHKNAVDITNKYLDIVKAKSKRGAVRVVTVPQGSEPPMFTSCFIGW